MDRHSFFDIRRDPAVCPDATPGTTFCGKCDQTSAGWRRDKSKALEWEDSGTNGVSGSSWNRADEALQFALAQDSVDCFTVGTKIPPG